MSSKTITPVILAGGKGTRLWPVSRTDLPKQFCKLQGEQSLFQQTLSRLCGSVGFGAPIILTGTAYAGIVRTQLAEIDIDEFQLVLEPCGKDTAPAIALASSLCAKNDHEVVMVLPSDHRIENSTSFYETVGQSFNAVCTDKKIVTFGITPTSPATGYGYLKAGASSAGGIGFELNQFIEKPDLATAEDLISQENVFWNAGIFMFDPEVMQDELNMHAPELARQVEISIEGIDAADQIILPDAEAFSEIEPISIDYAVMEKTTAAALVPINPDWSDVGSWNAVWETSSRDVNGNAIAGDAICVETENSFVSTDGPFVGVAGVSDLIVVANRDAILVTSRNASQSVKNLIQEMKAEYEPLTVSHASETRPWGKFTSLNKGEKHQVKSIVVNPGGQLSLQYHFHRAEHWIVVAGKPTVTVGKDVYELAPCQQVHIPQGAVHRLENHTEEPVQIIEVQYGSYLGEDDIVRLEDIYGRPEKEVSKREKPEGAAA